MEGVVFDLQLVSNLDSHSVGNKKNDSKKILLRKLLQLMIIPLHFCSFRKIKSGK